MSPRFRRRSAGRVTAYLEAVLPGRVMRSPEDFAGYGIHPLWVAPTPSHSLATILREEVATALDHTVATQERDGSWAPFWSWASVDPDAWELAEQEWRGSWSSATSRRWRRGGGCGQA